MLDFAEQILLSRPVIMVRLFLANYDINKYTDPTCRPQTAEAPAGGVFFVLQNKFLCLFCLCIILPESTRIYGENTTSSATTTLNASTLLFIKSR